ncbi:Translation initiation factor 3 subunit b [Bacidia gigantensis]|uniref:Translation initiation factor 3 subunit b n=1 Tax=Bacidia gigantensis TaxID=2732470 RepID=UPI001D05A032|nr:Translation initiation factor 3 subunit b [Bacidia gigantensis]KAG8525270.1 Translation initiation factor 3 subunit b [Bacidia gigantensis]
MAPGFNTLREDDDGYDSADDLDFSDLREQYDVRLEQGLDSFVVVDGLPLVESGNKAKLQKFLTGKLNASGFKIKDEGFYMPMGENGKSEGFAFVEYQTPQQAQKACKVVHGTPIDKKHTFGVNKITDIERYGREGRIDDEYQPPEIDDFQEKEHLRWWLGDPNCRDQFALYRGDGVAIMWNKKKDNPENIIDRQHWTERFVQWSPLGTYLATIHARGMQLWGGPSWSRQTRFPHINVDLVDFSPNEKYVCTWSFRPIEVAEDDPVLSQDDDGKNYIIWDLTTGRPIRSFAMYDLVTAPIGPEGQPIKKQVPWPAFKWSADDKYVARMKEGEGIHIYELPSMKALDKKIIPIEGVMDFEWSPATPQRADVKTYEQLFCFWTPEIGSNPAKVGLMSIPSKQIVRTRNLFNVTDAKLHWQSQAAYVCVKVDRHSKSRKSLATNLEIFRVREKGVPVEVVDALKDTVINFAWEPKGDRFVLITTAEVVMTTAVPPKTSVSFFCPEKIKGAGVGNFKHIRTIEKKNNNAIFWSPKGRFCVVGTVLSQQSFDLDFWDFDYEGDTHEGNKDLTANLQLVNTADHYGVTEVEWDPTGRYVTTGASVWKHTMENGYHLYDFKEIQTTPLASPAPTLLSRDEQKTIRKNLREYSKDFEEQDRIEEDKEKGAIVEERRRILSEWIAWKERERADLREEREDLGLDAEVKIPGIEEEEEKEGEKVVEEIIEEVLDEVEEIM